MNQDACECYKKADTRLNQTYQRILTEYRQDKIFLGKLKAAQRTWLGLSRRASGVNLPWPANGIRQRQSNVPLPAAGTVDARTHQRLASMDGRRGRRRCLCRKHQTKAVGLNSKDVANGLEKKGEAGMRSPVFSAPCGDGNCWMPKVVERKNGLGWTRTSGLLLRRQSLYPPELQAR